jgi:hypothetical protein
MQKVRVVKEKSYFKVEKSPLFGEKVNHFRILLVSETRPTPKIADWSLLREITWQRVSGNFMPRSLAMCSGRPK